MKVIKTTYAKKGGKKKSKATLKDREQMKHAAVHKVMVNLTDQMKKIETDCLRNVLEKHLGRELVTSDVEKIKKVKNEKGYVLCYDGIQLGELQRQHHTDKKAESNFRILFTPFQTMAVA